MNFQLTGRRDTLLTTILGVKTTCVILPLRNRGIAISESCCRRNSSIISEKSYAKLCFCVFFIGGISPKNRSDNADRSIRSAHSAQSRGQISDRRVPCCQGANAKLGTVYDHFVPEPYEK